MPVIVPVSRGRQRGLVGDIGAGHGLRRAVDDLSDTGHHIGVGGPLVGEDLDRPGIAGVADVRVEPQEQAALAADDVLARERPLRRIAQQVRQGRRGARGQRETGHHDAEQYPGCPSRH
jgi:hypothetical protein